ncbi:MAG: uroporphyrinogen decarboxylase family protein [Eubacteriales bacterium]
MIHKAKETMTSRERVLRTFDHAPVDRLAIDYSANPIIHGKFAAAIGCQSAGYETFLDALGVDFRGIGVSYCGPNLFEPMPGRATDPVYGCRTRWVENDSGGYNDFCDFPLLDAEPEEIAAFPVPSADDFDYGHVKDILKVWDRYALYVGNPGNADIINATGRVMGMEQTLINLIMEDEATLTYISRRCDMELGILERILDRAEGRIDFLFFGEDLGTQHTPLISLDLYRKVLKPFHKHYTDLAKAYGIPVMVHSCGSSSWAFEDFIEIGVRAVDTLQPEAAAMSPAYLKEHFGTRLSFHGGISTAGTLVNGTPEQVREMVFETAEIFNRGGGYFLAPTHMIQDNTPVENIVAMYQAAHDFRTEQ